MTNEEKHTIYGNSQTPKTDYSPKLITKKDLENEITILEEKIENIDNENWFWFYEFQAYPTPIIEQYKTMLELLIKRYPII